MTSTLPDPATFRSHRPKTWWPAVDALRGIAVLAVLLYHHDPRRVPGGFLGVSLFFTLSGFLITTLLLRERDTTGNISLPRFWARRFRRLAPVGIAGLALALVVGAIALPDARASAVAGDVRAAALYVANWRFAFAGIHYGDTLSLPSPVNHYWSLAIEEQFYAVYPILAFFALKRGRRGLLAVLLAAGALSIVRQLMLDDFNRIYLGTDTRVLELAVGGIAAIVWSVRHKIAPRIPGDVRQWLDIAGVVALAALVASWLTVHLGDHVLFHGGIAVHAALSAVVVIAAAGGPQFRRLGSFRPLVALGEISYGVYVVHFPLFLLLDAGRTHVSGLALLAVRLAATIAVASALHVTIETPVRFGGALPGRRGMIALVSATLAILLATVAMPHIGAASGAATAVKQIPVITMPTVATTTTTTTTVAAALTSIPAIKTPTTRPRPTRVPHLLVAGDSTANLNGYVMREWAKKTGGAVIDIVASPSCALYQAGRIRYREGWEDELPLCPTLVDRIIEAARSLKPDAIVAFIGSAELSDWKTPDETVWRHFGDPVFDARYVAAATSAIQRLGALGIPVLLADVPLPKWVPELQPGIQSVPPGQGEPAMNDPPRTARLNALTDVIVKGVRSVRIFAYRDGLAGPDGSLDGDRIDGLHAQLNRIDEGMNGWLRDLLRAGYQDIVRSGATPAANPNVWSP